MLVQVCVDYIRCNFKLRALCKWSKMSETTTQMHFSTSQEDKIRISTYQAIFIAHSQVKRHKIQMKYQKLQTRSTHPFCILAAY